MVSVTAPVVFASPPLTGGNAANRVRICPLPLLQFCPTLDMPARSSAHCFLTTVSEQVIRELRKLMPQIKAMGKLDRLVTI
jgi:hypothetical protein